MQGTLYTIGYEKFRVQDFVAALHLARVEVPQ
jgi:hypothetical protein